VGYNPDIPVKTLVILTIKREDIEVEIKKAREEQEKFLKDVDILLAKIIKL